MLLVECFLLIILTGFYWMLCSFVEFYFKTLRFAQTLHALIVMNLISLSTKLFGLHCSDDNWEHGAASNCTRAEITKHSSVSYQSLHNLILFVYNDTHLTFTNAYLKFSQRFTTHRRAPLFTIRAGHIEGSSANNWHYWVSFWLG